MNFNRKTKTYRLRVKKLAKAFRYPPRKQIDGVSRHMTFDEIIADQPEGTPRYLIEDALRFLAQECRRHGRYAEEEAIREKGLEEFAMKKLEQIKKPKLQLVGAA